MKDLDFSKAILPAPKLEKCPVIHDFSEYSGVPVEEIVECVRSNHAGSVREFNDMVAKHGNKRAAELDFYENTSTYIYDLLANQASPEGISNKLHKFLGPLLIEMKGAGLKFMEFGAGCGVLCHIMAEWGGKEVTHVDVQSEALEFARWRYEKYGVDVRIEVIPQDHFTLPETYDVIFSDAVWEHITPAQQMEYATYLANHLNPGGIFALIVDLSGVTKTEPMHYPVNIRGVHEMLESAGLTNSTGRNMFASVWRN